MEKALHPPKTEANPANCGARVPGFLAQLDGTSGRSLARFALVADLLVFVLLSIVAAIWPLKPLDRLTAVFASMLIAGYLAADTWYFAWALANSAAVRRRYCEAWARLPIEPAS